MIDSQFEENYLSAYGKAIFNFGKDVVPDVAEVAIDRLIDDGIIKEIPVVGTLVKAGKLVNDIRNAFFTKHLLVFAQKFNNGELTDKEIAEHFEELEKHPKKKIQELEVLLYHATKHKKYIQDMILANFYSLYCSPAIDFKWADFDLMAQITEDLYPGDLVVLKQIYEKQVYEEQDFDRHAINRLARLGLVDYFNGMSVARRNNAGARPFYAKINDMGKFFWEYGMKEVEILKDIDGESRIL